MADQGQDTKDHLKTMAMADDKRLANITIGPPQSPAPGSKAPPAASQQTPLFTNNPNMAGVQPYTPATQLLGGPQGSTPLYSNMTTDQVTGLLANAVAKRDKIGQDQAVQQINALMAPPQQEASVRGYMPATATNGVTLPGEGSNPTQPMSPALLAAYDKMFAAQREREAAAPGGGQLNLGGMSLAELDKRYTGMDIGEALGDFKPGRGAGGVGAIVMAGKISQASKTDASNRFKRDKSLIQLGMDQKKTDAEIRKMDADAKKAERGRFQLHGNEKTGIFKLNEDTGQYEMVQKGEGSKEGQLDEKSFVSEILRLDKESRNMDMKDAYGVALSKEAADAARKSYAEQRDNLLRAYRERLPSSAQTFFPQKDTAEKKVVKTGKDENGRSVVLYDDGSKSYVD